MAYASRPQGRCLVLRGIVLRANFLFVGFLANDSPGPKAKHSSCSCCCCCCSSELPVARILLQLCAADLTALLWLRSARHVPKSCRKCQVSLKVAIDEIRWNYHCFRQGNHFCLCTTDRLRPCLSHPHRMLHDQLKIIFLSGLKSVRQGLALHSFKQVKMVKIVTTHNHQSQSRWTYSVRE